MAVDVIRMTASVGSLSAGSGTVSTRTSRRPFQTTAFIDASATRHTVSQTREEEPRPRRGTRLTMIGLRGLLLAGAVILFVIAVFAEEHYADLIALGLAATAAAFLLGETGMDRRFGARR
jgi:hypothetical protein